jgi:hypothetical protein
LSGDFAAGVFGIGTTQDLFQQWGTLGTLPSFKDKLKRAVTAGATLNAVNFSILADIPSGPFDLLTSSDERSEISSSLQSSSLGKTPDGEETRKSVLSTGGRDL